ncbi:hypothetical protein DDB_G0279785 [Dictyostelium discoideum AX4]|uniref:Uncharacterized protein n=1 Tax=Dictyostelium discoideum TaxID=44689 RepID=Q54WA8_DICDI|nr:hypothetical protein DDB_G0279785 [Dictyostelium discoideum AX4]EAL67572.1 hypothetical protein DDB_G0279785 [Dictyostelium discoideum AX4]|eukprot:XP_641550.1 hypothetical protein DDB_G0279785 [Dictyostelium discoideum AX4]
MYELSTPGFDITICFSLLGVGDLEGNDINSIEFSRRINKLILPEYIIQAVFSVWFLITFRFFLFLLNSPVLVYHYLRYDYFSFIISYNNKERIKRNCY